jgi:molecular chaperone GrpE
VTPQDLHPDAPSAPAGEPATPDVAPAAEAAESAEALRDRWLRAEADLQNFRRRSRIDAEEARRDGEERVMLTLIEALDDLERALDAARSGHAGGAWLDGIELVATRLREGLARHGVSVIDPQGERFDPRFHEALLEIDAPEGVRPGDVVQVALRGYRRGDRALRAARVVVARGPFEDAGA